VSEARDALVAAYAARLDALLASWQLAIDAKRKAPITAGNAPPRTAPEVLAELEHELADLERHCIEQRQSAESEDQQAKNWEQRAMMALRDGREDLAREALARQQDHLTTATEQEAEAIELEAVRDSYRNAVTAVKATTGSPATDRA